MSIPIKTESDLKLMRESCQITARVLLELEDFVKPGISTLEIDKFVARRIAENGGIPSTLNYKGYPASCCTSVNNVICHGIPYAKEILKVGDIINIDVTTYKNGFHGDSSRMYFVGGRSNCSDEAVALVDDTLAALIHGIAVVKPGAYVGDIGATIQTFVRSLNKGYGIVKEYTGHGIGRSFHEPPQIVHTARAKSGAILKPGMTFTIEPMINAGTAQTILDKDDKWTVRTADGCLSAQWEHTVLVTESGVEILTGG